MCKSLGVELAALSGIKITNYISGCNPRCKMVSFAPRPFKIDAGPFKIYSGPVFGKVALIDAN